MTSATNKAVPSTPYRGVLPFRYADRSLFFGRETVVDDILVEVSLYRLVLLFGESGAGKSSVINAGLIPALEQKGLHAERLRVSPENKNQPILIERIQASDDPDGDLLPSIFDHDRSRSSRVDERLPCSIDQFLHIVREKAEEARPALVFDQFEELFTLFDSRGSDEATRNKQIAQTNILRTIFELANDEQLKVKLLIIIREDFLGKLEVLSKQYPRIFDHYVRLGHLDKNDAKKAIIGPFANTTTFASRLTEELAGAIIEELAKDDEKGNVHTTQLQIVCDQLWRKYAPTQPTITEREFEIEGRVAGILGSYFKSELEKLGPSNRALAISVLGNLITDSGTRDIVSEEKLKGLLGAEKISGLNSLPQTLKLLEDQRIINRTTQRGTFYFEVASEYLIKPIKKEKQQLDGDRRISRQRKQWALVTGGISVLFLLTSYIAYQQWLQTQPWGFLVNLSSGRVNELRGEAIYVGRRDKATLKATQNLKNQLVIDPKIGESMQLVGLKDLTISRLHFLLFNNLFAMDMRSLNGTTVNSQFLPYGDTRQLEDEDIIVLAGIAPYQFSKTRMLERPQATGWGIVIDGKSKIPHYLSKTHHTLSVNGEQNIVLDDGESSDSLLMINSTSKTTTIEDRADSYDLWVTMKLGDYTYVSCKVPPGRLFSFFNAEELNMLAPCKVLSGRNDLNDISQPVHDLFTVTYSYGDFSFQLVPVASDLEPSASPP
jgi:hypothetical protein